MLQKETKQPKLWLDYAAQLANVRMVILHDVSMIVLHDMRMVVLHDRRQRHLCVTMSTERVCMILC